MSGMDEVEDKELRCPECGSKKFYKAEYGSKLHYIDTREAKGHRYHQRDWESNDYERWQCFGCTERLDDDMVFELQSIESEGF